MIVTLSDVVLLVWRQALCRFVGQRLLGLSAAGLNTLWCYFRSAGMPENSVVLGGFSLHGSPVHLL